MKTLFLPLTLILSFLVLSHAHETHGRAGGKGNKLQKRKTKQDKNVITCQGPDGTYGGILQDCYKVASHMTNVPLSCAMYKTCAVSVVNPDGSPTTVNGIVSESDFRAALVRWIATQNCAAQPPLNFSSKPLAPVEQNFLVAVQFLDPPKQATSAEQCDDTTLQGFPSGPTSS